MPSRPRNPPLPQFPQQIGFPSLRTPASIGSETLAPIVNDPRHLSGNGLYEMLQTVLTPRSTYKPWIAQTLYPPAFHKRRSRVHKKRKRSNH